MILQLDITPDSEVPFFTHRTSLESKDYDLDFEWNDRRGLWVVTVRALAGTGEVLVATQTIRHGRNILARSRSANKPPGILYAWSSQPGNLRPPGVGELGGRVKIFYRTGDEL